MDLLIVDDSRRVREAMARLLDREDDMTVVATAADGHDALEKIQQLQPDLVLLDLEMEGMHGLQVLEALEKGAAPKVIIVSLHEEPLLIRRALAAGAAGYVSKQSAARELVSAVRAVAAGRRYLCRRAQAALGQH